MPPQRCFPSITARNAMPVVRWPKHTSVTCERSWVSFPWSSRLIPWRQNIQQKPTTSIWPTVVTWQKRSWTAEVFHRNCSSRMTNRIQVWFFTKTHLWFACFFELCIFFNQAELFNTLFFGLVNLAVSEIPKDVQFPCPSPRQPTSKTGRQVTKNWIN